MFISENEKQEKEIEATNEAAILFFCIIIIIFHMSSLSLLLYSLHSHSSVPQFISTTSLHRYIAHLCSSQYQYTRGTESVPAPLYHNISVPEDLKRYTDPGKTLCTLSEKGKGEKKVTQVHDAANHHCPSPHLWKLRRYTKPHKRKTVPHFTYIESYSGTERRSPIVYFETHLCTLINKVTAVQKTIQDHTSPIRTYTRDFPDPEKLQRHRKKRITYNIP